MALRATRVLSMRSTPKLLGKGAGWEQAANGFPEIPKGVKAWDLWYNPAIIPLWGVIGLAGFVCGGFMFKYFLGHTEVNWTKKNRMTHDNQGIDDAKVASHNSRFGMRKMNKHQVKVFPFNFIPMDGIIERHS